MKTKIIIPVIAILLTGYGVCFAPDNNLPKNLYAYEIPDLTRSKWIKEPIKVKKALKYQTKKGINNEIYSIFR